jgi:hypothetical protein
MYVQSRTFAILAAPSILPVSLVVVVRTDIEAP